jgi:hypothetical protein
MNEFKAHGFIKDDKSHLIYQATIKKRHQITNITLFLRRKVAVSKFYL